VISGLFTSGASFSLAHEYSMRNQNSAISVHYTVGVNNDFVLQIIGSTSEQLVSASLRGIDFFWSFGCALRPITDR